MNKRWKKVLTLVLSLTIVTSIFSGSISAAAPDSEGYGNEQIDVSAEEAGVTTESPDAIIQSESVESAILNEETLSENDPYDFSDRGLGCLPEEPDAAASVPVIESGAEEAALPGSCDMSANFPTPGNQGGQGSCTAWAVGYALKSYQEKTEHRWNYTEDHLFSPAYIYNQINDGVDKGTTISRAMNLIIEQGVCSIATMPYKVNDYRTKPNSVQRTEAAKYKASSYAQLSKSNLATGMKTQLSNGNPVVIGVDVYESFYNLTNNNPIYKNTSGDYKGRHAVCVVGYDDSKQAFKFINSWGSNWCMGGYGYISYNLLSTVGTTGFVLTDIIDVINVTNVTLNTTSLIMEINGNAVLTASVSPGSATYKNINWSSSNSSIAAVDANGRITAKAGGTAQITATNPASGHSASCTVYVTTQLDAYIKGYYNNCLGRTPSTNEISYWKEELFKGYGSTLVNGFFFSKEFIDKKHNDSTFIDLAYKTILERSPDATGKKHFLNYLSTGLSRQFILQCLTESAEFQKICAKYNIPHSILKVVESRDKIPGATQFIYRLFKEGLGRTPSTSDLNHHADLIIQNKITGAGLAHAFFMGKEFTDKNISNDAYVERLYRALLNRNPDAVGKATWVAKLNSGASRLEVLKGIVNSNEFTNICNKIGIVRGTL